MGYSYSKSRAGCVLPVALIGLQLVLPASSAIAEGGAAQGVSTGMNANPTAQFDAARQAAMGTLFSSCQGSMLANAAGAVAACFAAPLGTSRI